jgi:hypothetical protein
LTSALDGGERSASRPGRGKSPRYLSPRTGLDGVEKGKILAELDSNSVLFVICEFEK